MPNAAPGNAETSTARSALFTDDLFLLELRESMMAFARLQLQNDALAEDAVQEALSGALAGAKAFGRRSAVRTWVFAILKNKIADTLRKASRYVDAETLQGEAAVGELIDTLFDRRGHWHEDAIPRGWTSPSEACGNEQFWRVFDACLERLPANHARLFMMREMLELDSDEILQATGVSLSNLNVSLYRARLQLRECLDTRWFNSSEEG